MYYKNAKIYTQDFRFQAGAFSVENGRFAEILPESVPADAVDLQGAYVIPGLVDVHNHGNSGRDFSDGDYEGLKTMAAYLGRCGVTSFAPASMTLPYDVLAKAFATAKRLKEEAPAGLSRLMGIQMEGPFFSEKKKGAQNGAYLRDPDFEAFQALEEGCGGLIRIVDVAPELPGSVEFIERAKTLCTVSVAHTDANYEEAKAAFDAGATHVTHLYNAMSQHLHREPGAVTGAFLEEGLYAELIADGYHVDPDVVRMTYRCMGPERLILITDAMLGKGMPDGDFVFSGLACRKSGLEVKVIDGGRRAGSAIGLNEALRRMQQMTGCGPCQLVQMACVNPARLAGLEGKKGRLVAGMDADLALFDSDWICKGAMVGGKWLWRDEV